MHSPHRVHRTSYVWNIGAYWSILHMKIIQCSIALALLLSDQHFDDTLNVEHEKRENEFCQTYSRGFPSFRFHFVRLWLDEYAWICECYFISSSFLMYVTFYPQLRPKISTTLSLQSNNFPIDHRVRTRPHTDTHTHDHTNTNTPMHNELWWPWWPIKNHTYVYQHHMKCISNPIKIPCIRIYYAECKINRKLSLLLL